MDLNIKISDFHTHTCYSDGKNTPEEMILAAIEKNMPAIGISDHSYTYFDESYCMAKDRIKDYLQQTAVLKAKYAEEIKVLCGIEQDYYSLQDTAPFDYVIGSAHYIRLFGDFVPVDETPDQLLAAAEDYFDGDIYTLIERYFAIEADMINQTHADIIGHFDLISKFNEKGQLFDPENLRYRSAWQHAADTLILTGNPFEINTGAISRGYRTSPYPSGEMIAYIAKKGGKFILSGDAHSADAIGHRFDECLKDWPEIQFVTLMDF